MTAVQRVRPSLLCGMAAFLVVFLADQWTKTLVAQSFPWHTTRPSVVPFLYITPTQNKGSAFGLFQGSVVFFAMLSLAAVVVMALFARRLQGGLFVHLGFGFVFGGALGNFCDRVRHHYVVDFLDLKFWPVFNVADAAIVAGMFCITVSMFRKKELF